MQKASFYTRAYLHCPKCNVETEKRVDHLQSPNVFPQSFGPWRCHSCDAWYQGVVKSPEDVELEIVDLTYKVVDTYILLKLEPLKGPLFFILKTRRLSNDTIDDLKYFYEEMQCPTNFIPVEKIVYEDDTDPHGLFDYVTYQDITSKDTPDFTVLFPEIIDVQKDPY